MNKSQLVAALEARLGDRRTAATAVDGLLETIVDTVRTGESVSITGFGVFESRARAARTARNPRTGETVHVPATTVPAFRPGVGFRTAVNGAGAAPALVAAAAPVVEAVVAPEGKKSGSAKKAGKDRKGDQKARNKPEQPKAGKKGKKGKK